MVSGSGSTGPPSVRTRATALCLRDVRMVLSSDLALIYAAIVLLIAVTLALATDATHDRVIAVTSTNLSNLRDHPLWVLFASAFVVPNLFSLWQLLLLLPLFTAAQQWVGRIATIVIAFLGHIGATLFVATVLSSGIFHGWISRSVVRVDDVGISYGLASLAGFLVMRVPRPWRWVYLGAVVAYFALPLGLSPGFTSLGHATALGLGMSLSWVAYRVSVSAQHPATRAVDS